MAEHFAQGRIVFDTCGKTGAKMISKTWLKQAEIKDVNAYFPLEMLKGNCPLVRQI